MELLGALEVRRRTGGWQAAHGREQARAALAPPPNSRPGCLSGIVATIAPVAGLTTLTLLRRPSRSNARR